MECAKCGNSDAIKYGFARGKQRFFCNYGCGYQFTKEPNFNQDKEMAVALWQSGLSRRIVGKLFDVNEVTIYRWSKELDPNNYEVYAEEQLFHLDKKTELFGDDEKKIKRIIRKLKRQAKADDLHFKQNGYYHSNNSIDDLDLF